MRNLRDKLKEYKLLTARISILEDEGIVECPSCFTDVSFDVLEFCSLCGKIFCHCCGDPFCIPVDLPSSEKFYCNDCIHIMKTKYKEENKNKSKKKGRRKSN